MKQRRRITALLSKRGIGHQKIDPVSDDIIFEIAPNVGFRVSLWSDETDTIVLTPLHENIVWTTPGNTKNTINIKPIPNKE